MIPIKSRLVIKSVKNVLLFKGEILKKIWKKFFEFLGASSKEY